MSGRGIFGVVMEKGACSAANRTTGQQAASQLDRELARALVTEASPSLLRAQIALSALGELRGTESAKRVLLELAAER